MKILAAVLVLFLSTVFAQDFTGTFRDDDGDLHSFEMQADGTLLGRLTVDDAVYEVSFEIENGQAIGVLDLDGFMLGFLMTPINPTHLSVQVVPFDENSQPLTEQVATYTFTRESTQAEVAQPQQTPSTNPLGSKPIAQNPLATPSTNPSANQGAALSGIAIEPNQTYTAGTTLVSASVGFSLTVPAGNVATYTTTETGQTGLVIQDQESSGFIVLGFSKADMRVLLQADYLGLANMQLIPVGTPQETSDGIRATFQMDANGTPLALHIATRQGVAGNAVLMLGFAVAGQDAGLSQALASTLASLVFNQPVAPNVLSLGGLELNADGSSSTSNSSGDAHLTGVREESYVFCSDGSYGYFMEDTTMFSSSDLPSGDFSDFSSEERDQHQGRYEMVSGIMGEPYLLLQASDGRIFLHTVNQSAEGIVVNGSSFSVAQSGQCQ